MSPKEAHARSEIDRISQIPLRQRTPEDRNIWDLSILQRDFCVDDTRRQNADAESKALWRKRLGKNDRR